MEEDEQIDHEAEQQGMAEAESQAEQEQGLHIVKIRADMTEKVKSLSTKRDIVENLSKNLQEKRSKFEEEWKEKHQNEIDFLNKEREDIGLIETELREMALKDYEITKEKKLPGGLGIRIMKKLEYNTDTALGWAEEHGIGLTLDKRAFESFVKSQEKDLKKAKLDFVEIKENPIATIPSKLK